MYCMTDATAQRDALGHGLSRIAKFEYKGIKNDATVTSNGNKAVKMITKLIQLC